MVTNVLESKPNVDLGILIGLLLTDGNLCRRGKTSLQIELNSGSEELHRLFKEKMRSVFGRKKFTEKVDKRKPHIKKTSLTSKFIGTKLLQFSPTFRKKQFDDGTFPLSIIPKFIFDLSREDICKVLQAMFSADGSIILSICWDKEKNHFKIKPEIQFSCKNPLLRSQMKSLLIQQGFQPKENVNNGDLRLTRKTDIIKFSKDVAFISGVKISGKSKNWKGFEKNQILDLAIKTLKLRKKDLEKFKSKEEIVNFLKSVLVPA